MLSRILLAAALAAAPLAAQATYSASPIGPGCGPNLAVTFTPNGENETLNLDLTNAYPNEWAWSIFGFSTVNYTFPNGCTLYQEYSWGTSHPTDEFGATTWSRSWPNTAKGYFRIQFITFRINKQNVAEWELSNAVLAECK